MAKKNKKAAKKTAGGKIKIQPLGDRVVDSHWTLTSSADPTYDGLETYTVKSDEYPIPPWMANTSTSMWICPRQDGTEVEARDSIRVIDRG